MINWRLISEILPPKGQWVIVTTEDYQKPCEIMCYLGTRIGRHDIGNGWEDYEFPTWTSGHGDVRSTHPYAWMPLPQVPKKKEEEK